MRALSAPGISHAYIARVESGERRPSVKALRILARKLGVTPEFLETGSDVSSSGTRELRLAEQELLWHVERTIDLKAVRALIDDAEVHADTTAAGRARILLGFEAATRGAHGESVEHLSDVVDTPLVTPSTRPDVYSTLGRALAAGGSLHEAVALFERALADIGPATAENRSARIQYASYLSYALTDLGELQRARAALATASGEDAGDRYTTIRMHWAHGRLALERAQPAAALDSFRKAIALLEDAEDALHLARAHIACADAVLSADDEPTVARGHLAEAELLLGHRPPLDDLAMVRRHQAACATASGAPAEGARIAEEAIALAAEFPAERGLAWLALAEAQTASADPAADASFAEAVRLVERNGSIRDTAAVLRSYGRFLRTSDREREALDVFERAANIAANLQAAPKTSP